MAKENAEAAAAGHLAGGGAGGAEGGRLQAAVHSELDVTPQPN